MSGDNEGFTVDCDHGLLLFALLAAGDTACVEAAVRPPELRDGQDVVEQHVHRVLHQPFKAGARVVSLEVQQ